MKTKKRFTIESNQIEPEDTPSESVPDAAQPSESTASRSEITIEKIKDAVTAIVRGELNNWQPVASTSGDMASGSSAKDDDPAKNIFKELSEIQSYIETSRAEIAALKPDEGQDSQFSTAKLELQEIVDATARATNDILSESERIVEISNTLVERLPDDQLEAVGEELSALDMASTQIMLACGFQDLTGQRITKVVNTMIFVEERINKLMELWNVQKGTGTGDLISVRPDDERPDKELLNGPQKAGEGISQNDIDAMFA